MQYMSNNTISKQVNTNTNANRQYMELVTQYWEYMEQMLQPQPKEFKLEVEQLNQIKLS